MNRRLFFKTGMSSLAIFHGIRAARADTPANELLALNHFFYDERFNEARRLAARLASSDRLVPVQGDMTALWNDGLNRTCRQSPLTLRGITTESFYFCLKIMMTSRASVEAQVNRIDRDLFSWTIRSNPFP